MRNGESDGQRQRMACVPDAADLMPSGSLESIDLYINAECNLTCRTCFLGDAYFTGQRMEEATADGILRWASAQGVREVAILGGEPTLHPGLDQILRSARSRGFTKIRLVSNGSGRLLRLLRSPAGDLVDSVYVSLDGATAMTHDAIRGKGSFRSAMRSVNALGAMERHTVLTFTVTRASAHEVRAMLELADASRSAALNIHWMSAMGRAADEALSLSAEEWSSVVDEVARYKKRRAGLSIYCQTAYARVGRLSSEPTLNRCLVRSNENLQFLPSGRVHACGLTVDEPELAAYEWSEGRLVNRSGLHEREVCSQFAGDGCPIRSARNLEPPVDPAKWIRICIYNRTGYGRTTAND